MIKNKYENDFRENEKVNAWGLIQHLKLSIIETEKECAKLQKAIDKMDTYFKIVEFCIDNVSISEQMLKSKFKLTNKDTVQMIDWLVKNHVVSCGNYKTLELVLTEEDYYEMFGEDDKDSELTKRRIETLRLVAKKKDESEMKGKCLQEVIRMVTNDSLLTREEIISKSKKELNVSKENSKGKKVLEEIIYELEQMTDEEFEELKETFGF